MSEQACAAEAASCEKRPVRIDDFASYQYVGALRVTKDGKRLVYALSSVNMEKNRYECDLWTLDLASGSSRRLTNSGKEGHFDLLDDGDVLFVSGRGKAQAGEKKDADAGKLGDGATQAQVASVPFEKTPKQLAEDPAQGTDLYRISLDGGEAELFAHVALNVMDWKQLDDRRFLVLARDLIDSASAYATIEDIPFWENGGTYKSGLREGVYLLDLDAENAARPVLLTQLNESVEDWALSEDRTKLYFVSKRFDTRKPMESQARVMELATGKVCDLNAPAMEHTGIALIDEGTLVLVGTDMKTHGINEDPFVYALDLGDDPLETGGSNFRRISRDDFDVDFFNAVGSDCRRGHGQSMLAVGGDLLFIHSQGDSSWLSRITSDGEMTPLVDCEGSIECFDTLDGHVLYYVAMRMGRLPEIYWRVLDEEGVAVGDEECLTGYSDVLEGAEIVEPEPFEFQSNGDTLVGYVMKPVGYEPGKKYPGVLWVHGGPKTTLGRLLFHEMQYLCGLGYFVFYTNPHGSGGHGVKFSDIRGHYGDIDFDDLMTFTDQVLERYPDVDPGRLAEMGGSYGGFMTNWVIGHTDRFRCTNSQRSISNWVSMFGVADIGYYFADDQTDAWPWGPANGKADIEKMWDQSPLKYADKVKTPTLFLHSDEDYRCPLEQGMQMFTALQLHDVPTRLVVFKGENHELSRGGKPQARVRRLTEIANWYARWLKDEPAGEPTLREEPSEA